MANPPRIDKHDFTVEVDGKTYKCHRLVSGTRALTQRIYVTGCEESKADDVRYGQRGRPESTMEGIAKMIAREIIRENKKSPSN